MKNEKKARAEFPDKPSTDEILTSRLAAGDTQEQAGSRVYVRERTWQDWERGERSMPSAAFELYLRKTKQALERFGKRQK